MMSTGTGVSALQFWAGDSASEPVFSGENTLLTEDLGPQKWTGRQRRLPMLQARRCSSNPPSTISGSHHAQS